MAPARTRNAAEPRIMVTDDMLLSRDWHRKQVPTYRVEETAKFFFGMSASWLRRLLRPGKDHPDTWFVWSGKRMEFRRLESGRTSARVFLLSDVEKMAYSLRAFDVIDQATLVRVLDVVQAEAYLYKLFDLPDREPGRAGKMA